MLAAMHDKPVSQIASEGGTARAQSLTKQERIDIAKKAAAARWSVNLPAAQCDGTLTVGDLEIACAVLADGTRVIAEQTFMQALGMYRSGALSTRRKRATAGGAQVPLFLAHKNLRPYAERHLGGVHFEPLKYRTLTGNTAHGIKAELIPKVCEIWIDANRDGVLGHRQKVTATKADILLRGFAHVGIIALVDEATGYQDARARDALAKILQQFVTTELKKWVNTFPTEFYKELFRLRGWRFPKLSENQGKRPILVGKITNDVVYARLAPGVRQSLHRLTPRDSKGRLKNKLFQRLTDNVGEPKLREHLASVVALMKASDEWSQFMRSINRALPKYKDLPLFDALD